MATVEVWLDKNNEPLKYEDAITYEKGHFFCVKVERVYCKFPIDHIFMVRESQPEVVVHSSMRG